MHKISNKIKKTQFNQVNKPETQNENITKTKFRYT
jgi:hypothetical protein